MLHIMMIGGFSEEENDTYNNVALTTEYDHPNNFRCDGVLEDKSRKNQSLRRLIKQVSTLSGNQSVNLLDISVKNITKLPGKLFQNLNLELSGLVISTGELAGVDKKVIVHIVQTILHILNPL